MEDSRNNGSIVTMIPPISSQEVDGGTPKPILPPEMMQHIFQLLRLRELLLCREVCHQWKNGTTNSARKKSSILPMCFEDCDNIEDFAVWDKLTNCLSVDPENFPISGFHIRLTRYFWEDYSSHYKTFFNVISQFATELSFEFRQTEDEDNFPLLPKGLRFDGSYQKLKHLSLDIPHDYIGVNIGREKNLLNDDDDTDVISPLRSIIENAPKLDNITLTIGLATQKMQTIPRCIEALGIRPRLELLTSLSINCGFGAVDWATLTTIGLKLKTFVICFSLSFWPVDTEILRAFLASQATTLISLEFSLYNWKEDDEVSVELPCLLHVTKLTISELDSLHIRPRNLKFLGFSFNTQLPSLEELDLNEAKNSMTYLFPTHAATPLDSLEKLVIPKSLLEWEIIGMPELAQLFPNIKKLHLNNSDARTDDNDYIIEILENMTGLEEFSISLKDQSADFAVTGLSPEYCRKIKAPPSRSWLLAIRELQRPTAVTMTSLENLQVLRILRETENWTGPPELTEISGYVLKKMKSLKYLDFGVRKFPPIISKDLRDDLEKHGIQILSQSPRHKRTQSDLPPGDYSSDGSDSDTEAEFEYF